MFSNSVIINEFHPSSFLYVIEMLAVAACISGAANSSVYSRTGVRALWLCGDHGPLHFRAVIVCSSYSDDMTASSFIVYNITACSVPNADGLR